MTTHISSAPDSFQVDSALQGEIPVNCFCFLMSNLRWYFDGIDLNKSISIFLFIWTVNWKNYARYHVDFSSFYGIPSIIEKLTTW